MKKKFVVIALMAFATTNAYAGKWLDYGNGSINIDAVQYINPSKSYVPSSECKKNNDIAYQPAIKFDEFTLQVGSASCDQGEAEETALEYYEKVMDFLGDDDTYMSL